MPTYQDLLSARSDKNGNALYWNPQAIFATPFSLFGTDDLLCEPEWNVEPMVSKLIALGLELELPVGIWVNESRKSLKNISVVALKLLKTNIKDETAHYKGFKYAQDAYPVPERVTREAKNISEFWLNNSEHPLAKAGLAEMGVFLLGLGLLRLAGGSSLSNMAYEISSDEFRHVATNRGILRDLSYDFQNSSNILRSLVKDTLAWITDGVKIPGDALGEDFDIDTDFIVDQSSSLIEKGIAPEFNQVLSFRVHKLPFELRNRSYEKVSEDALEDFAV